MKHRDSWKNFEFSRRWKSNANIFHRRELWVRYKAAGLQTETRGVIQNNTEASVSYQPQTGAFISSDTPKERAPMKSFLVVRSQSHTSTDSLRSLSVGFSLLCSTDTVHVVVMLGHVWRLHLKYYNAVAWYHLWWKWKPWLSQLWQHEAERVGWLITINYSFLF